MNRNERRRKEEEEDDNDEDDDHSDDDERIDVSQLHSTRTRVNPLPSPLYSSLVRCASSI